jgi:hypothetical protein
MANFTLVGSPTAISVTGFSGSGTVTLSTIGNVLIVGTSGSNTGQTLTCTGCSGGMMALTSLTGLSCVLWMGVITATGTQTLSGTDPYYYQGMIAQEVAYTGSVLPSVDVSAEVVSTFTASGVGNFPSITPANDHDIIFCVGSLASTATMSTTTSGYTYSATATSDFSGFLYMAMNPDIPVGVAQTPNWIASSGLSNGGTLLSVALSTGRMRLIMSP